MHYNQEDLITIEPINNEGLNLPFIALVERCYFDEGEYNVEATILESKIEFGHIVANMQQVEEIMNTKPGFVKAMWCGDPECELKMKEIRGTKSRCILEDAQPISDKCVCCGKEAKHTVVWGIQY